MKNNLSYYRHEVTSHNHWKFKLLRKEYGWEGEGKFWALNNEIAASENCVLDISDEGRKMSLAIDLDFEEADFDKYILYLSTKCKLIDVDDNRITTEITQENLEEVSRDRKRKSDWIKAKREQEKAASGQEIDGEEPSNDGNNENVDVYNKEIDGDIEQSKGKESKLNSIVSNDTPETAVSVPSPDVELRKEYRDIADDPKKIEAFIKNKRPCFIEPYARLWNFLAVEKGFAQVTTLTDPRKRKIKTRSREDAFDFAGVLDKARNSSFLQDNKSWFTFDWILENQKNYVKVLEGNYDNKKQSQPKEANNDYLQQREKAKARLAARA